MESARKIGVGVWSFMGWDIEKIEGRWLMKPEGSSHWTDSADTLREAKLMIARWAAA